MIIDTNQTNNNDKALVSPLLLSTVMDTSPFELYPMIKPYLVKPVEIHSGIEMMLRMKIIETLQDKKNSGAIDNTSALSLKCMLSTSDDDSDLNMIYRMSILGGNKNMDMKTMLPFMLMNKNNKNGKKGKKGSDDSGGIDPMMMYFMMNNNDGDSSDMNSMLPLMMMSGGGDMSSMLPFMLMNKNGEGSSDMNPMMMYFMMNSNDGAIDPTMLYFMMNNNDGDSSDMNSMLPLMMMSGGGDMNPMMMYFMMNNNDGDGESSDMNSMLPLMMMNGGGDMNPMMMYFVMKSMNKKKEGKRSKSDDKIPDGPSLGGTRKGSNKG